MSEIKLGFVGGDTEVDKIIKFASGAEEENITHAFVELFDSIYESEGIKQPYNPYPGVWISEPDKYDNNPYVKYVIIDVPDISALKKKARELLGTMYGYTDCISTGIKLLTGADVLINGEHTAMCSETVTRLLRAGGINILSALKPDQISPVALYRAVKEIER